MEHILLLECGGMILPLPRGKMIDFSTKSSFLFSYNKIFCPHPLVYYAQGIEQNLGGALSCP